MAVVSNKVAWGGLASATRVDYSNEGSLESGLDASDAIATPPLLGETPVFRTVIATLCRGEKFSRPAPYTFTPFNDR